MSNKNQQQTTMMMSSNRDVHWTMVAVGTTVALVALVTGYKSNGYELSNPTTEYKWAAAAISISFIVAWCAVFANIFARTLFVGTVVEGVMSLIVCGFWAAVMPTLMCPENTVSVSSPVGGIRNANLYFFTWFSFVMSFVTLVHFVTSRFDTRNTTNTTTPSRYYIFTTWGILAMTSIVVSVSAGRLTSFLECADVPWSKFYQGMDGEVDLKQMCRRSTFAICIGTVGGLVSIMWMLMDLYWKNAYKQTIEVILGCVMFTLWIFGVGFITFGTSSPAMDVGNLFFFSWGSFVSSLLILLQACQVFRDSRMTLDESENDQHSGSAAVVDEKENTGVDNVVAEGDSSA